MVNVSIDVVFTYVHKEWCARYYYRLIKKVTHFNGKTPSFYNMMNTQIFHKHIYQDFQ